MPIPQYEVYDDNGRLVAVVDFAWPELGLFVEFDGKIKYRAPDRDGETVVDVVLREKKREELVCRITGWRCLRVVWADLYQPAHTAHSCRAVPAGDRGQLSGRLGAHTSAGSLALLHRNIAVEAQKSPVNR